MDTSAALGQKLMQGWVMLNEYCPHCLNVPLMRSRDGSQIICVDCDAKPPAAVQKKAEKQHETAPSQDYSSHLELLEQATLLIFKKMSLWEDTFAYNVATDALASLAAVSGGKVSRAFIEGVESILIEREQRLAAQITAESAEIAATTLTSFVNTMKIRAALQKLK